MKSQSDGLPGGLSIVAGLVTTFLVSLREDPVATPIADWVRSLVAARVAA